MYHAFREGREEAGKASEGNLQQGVDLYLEGEPASPEEIARKFFVNEDTVYMPDFVTDEDGTLQEVRYDRVEYR